MNSLEKRLKINKDSFDQLSNGGYSLELKNCVSQLGGSYRALGFWNEALNVFDCGMSLCTKANDHEGIGEFLIWKSNVYYHSGFYGRAIEFASKALELDVSTKARVNWMSYYLGKPFLMLGDVEKYIELQNQAINLSESLEKEAIYLNLPWFLSDLADGLNLIDASEKAYKIIKEQVENFKSINHVHGIPYSLMILGKVLLRLNRPDESKLILSEALIHYEKLKRECYVVDILVELSKAELNLNNISDAKFYIDKAIEEARKGPREIEGLADKIHLNGALVTGSSFYFRINENKKAIELFYEAMDLAIESNRKLMLQELQVLSRVYMNKN